MAIIMIPNIVYAVKHKNETTAYHNKAIEISEQVSRYGCFVFMVFNIPYTWIGFYFRYAEIVYIVVNSVFVFAYCLIWLILWEKTGIVKALLLSVIPSLIFMFSGVMIASIPLILFAVIFSFAHVFISVKNAMPYEK